MSWRSRRLNRAHAAGLSCRTTAADQRLTTCLIAAASSAWVAEPPQEASVSAASAASSHVRGERSPGSAAGDDVPHLVGGVCLEPVAERDCTGAWEGPRLRRRRQVVTDRRLG